MNFSRKHLKCQAPIHEALPVTSSMGWRKLIVLSLLQVFANLEYLQNKQKNISLSWFGWDHIKIGIDKVVELHS